MWPPPRRWGRKARMPCTTPHRFTPRTHSHPAIGPNHGSPAPDTPALLHTTWTPPNRSRVASASAWTAGSLLTSVVTDRVSTPCAPTRSAADASASSCTSARTTRSPRRANASASANPIPLAAPVTTAICPGFSSMEANVVRRARPARRRPPGTGVVQWPDRASGILSHTPDGQGPLDGNATEAHPAAGARGEEERAERRQDGARHHRGGEGHPQGARREGEGCAQPVGRSEGCPRRSRAHCAEDVSPAPERAEAARRCTVRDADRGPVQGAPEAEDERPPVLSALAL